MAGAARPLFSFGCIADVQYADKADTHVEGRTQRFREVPCKLAACLDDYRSQQPPLSCVLHLGDIIDGNSTPPKTASDLTAMLDLFGRLPVTVPVHHVLGNHCLAAGRQPLLRALGLGQGGYYAARLHPGWLLVVLDTTELSGHSGLPQDCEVAREAAQFVASHPVEQHPQMSPWNGGIGQRQLSWLQGVLQQAEEDGSRVIVASHHQIGKGAARDTHMAWNWREIESLLLQSRAVVLGLAGHDHQGGYASTGGVHFVTLQALVEAPPDFTAYCVVHVHADRVEIQGRGTVPSRVMQLRS